MGDRSLVTRTDIIQCARTWLGTPHHHGACLKGVGVDCLGLVYGVYRELYDYKTPLPHYTTNWMSEERQRDLVQGLEKEFTRVSKKVSQLGDVLVIRFLRWGVGCHCAFLSYSEEMGPSLIHVATRGIVREVPYLAPLRKRTSFVFRMPNLEMEQR
jgi:NlpC/P60 family putative phage cell wall peptidase